MRIAKQGYARMFGKQSHKKEVSYIFTPPYKTFGTDAYGHTVSWVITITHLVQKFILQKTLSYLPHTSLNT
jgi:hypothetical protein